MPLQPPPRPLSVLASVLGAAGIVVAVGGCSGITPLGPDQTPVAMPPQRHLGSPIIVQVMRSRPPTAAGGCPAGWVAVSMPPGAAPHLVHLRAVHPARTSAPSTPLAVTPCYRPAGSPVTITSAAVSPVSVNRPPPDPPQGAVNGPVSYGFTIAVPAAAVPAVTAVIRQAYDSGGAVGISVAGKLWQAPQVAKPFPGQQLQIALLSRNQAQQLHRILVPSG
jgi:hypothetical protein